MARRTTQQEVSESITVNCSAEQAWLTFTNNRTIATWAPQVQHSECAEDFIDVGVKRTSTLLIDGKEGQTVEQCTRADQPNRLDYDIVEETFGFAHMLKQYGFSVSFDEKDNTTTVTMQTRFEAKKIFSRVLSSDGTIEKMRLMMQEMLQGFKTFVES